MSIVWVEVTESLDEEIESVRITQPLDYATEERQSRISNMQPNWYAALGMCICLLSAGGVIMLAIWLAE